MLGAIGYAAPQARVRARRAELLSAGQWRLLLETPDVAAVRERLHTTAYGREELPEEAAALERALAGRLAAETRSLARGLPDPARRLLEAYGRRFEVDNLKSLLRALLQRPAHARWAQLDVGLDTVQDAVQDAVLDTVLDTVLVSLPEPTLPWQALREAGSLSSFIERLRGTPYAEPLELAQERFQQEGSIFYLEVALDLAYFQRLLQRMRQLPTADRREAERLLGYWIDLQNLLWAFRYRLYAGMKPEEILNFTLHRAHRVDVAAIRRVALGSRLHDEAARLGLRIPEAVAPESVADVEALPLLEQLGARKLQQLAETTFTRALFHVGGVLAYLLLLEGEVHDLITLIEGKRLGLDADALRPLLYRES